MEMLRSAARAAHLQHELLEQERSARSRDREQKHEENMQKLRAGRPVRWGQGNRHERRVAARRERQKAKV